MWWDQIYPAKDYYQGIEIAQLAEELNVGQSLTLEVSGENLEGNIVSKTVRLPFDDRAVTGEERVSSMGLMLSKVDNKMIVDMVEFGSPAEASGIDFDWEITNVVLDAERPLKEWVFIPTLLLLFALGFNQRRRAKKENLAA